MDEHTTENEQVKSATAPGWSVVRVKDERRGNLFLDFTLPVGDGTFTTQSIGNELSPEQIVRKLRSYTTQLPGDRKAVEFVTDLIQKAIPQVLQVHAPGWRYKSDAGARATVSKPDAFVTPGRCLGPGRNRYRWAQSQRPSAHLGQVRGNMTEWRKAYRALADLSNYVAFAQMAALAGPLRPWDGLPEAPVFNFSGQSSTGKTTAAKCGAAVQGNPEAIVSWDLTARGLEETTASNNHVLLVLNAAERASPHHRKLVLGMIVHMVSEGRSRKRSTVVQDTLPDLQWSCVTLSTSNLSGRGMAAELKLPWADQDDARFIDIPVPANILGGIFDRLPKTIGESPDRQSADLIGELEEALAAAFGAPLGPWIEYLLIHDPSQLLTAYTDRFMKKVGSPTGLDGRIARKFGLVYAAGKIANKHAKLLHWPRSLPLRAVKCLYARARDARGNATPVLHHDLKTLRRLLAAAKLVRRAKPRDEIELATDSDLVGVRYRLNGQSVVGLRLESLRAHLGAGTNGVLQWLSGANVLLGGHGNRTARQLPVRLKVGKDLVEKPRFLVLDRKGLTNALADLA